MKTMKTLLATAAAFGALAGTTLPATAQEVTPWPEAMMRAADRNKDGMVTRQEFLEHMAAVWDAKHASMMKEDKTMKAGMMDRTQFMTFVRAMFIDPGKIGG